MIKEYNKSSGAALEYIASFPDDFDECKRYPVIIFLHGAGTREPDINLLKTNSGFTKLCAYKYEPCIVVAPHCTGVDWFEHMQDLVIFTKHILSQSFTDCTRIYLTGNSMGGFGCFELAMLHPDWFAAIMPVCGGGMSWNSQRLKNVPTFAFHGLLDDYVPVDEPIRMVNGINSAGGTAKVTLYPECGHNCWDNAYSDTDAISWVLSHKKAENATLFDELSGKKFG